MDPDNAEIAKAHKATFSYSYWTRMDALNGHQHTIELFEVALRDSSWPVNDIAVKQEFQIKTPLRHPVTKTGWDTTFFVLGVLDKGDDVEMDEMSDTGGSEWSDQMTMADDGEVSNSSLLPTTV